MIKTEYYQEREQTAVKHEILERYLKAFTPIIASWAKEIAYVDTMAGPWKSASESLEDTSFYRALSVFRDAKDSGRCGIPIRSLLIEKDKLAFYILEQYVASLKDSNVVARNWDFADHVEDVVRFAKKNGAFSFVFLDPKGWELIAIDTIRPILQLQGEVLITFMTSWVKRFFSDSTKPFERLLGHSDVARLRALRGDELEDELVASYARAVRIAGNYEYTCALPVMMGNKDAFHFHMIYGTRHPRGVQVFKEAEKKTIKFMHELRAEAQQRRKTESSGQGFLLPAPETYRELRFSRFHEIALRNARSAIMNKLTSKGFMMYADVELEGLQYSTVLKEDIRDWALEWMKSGQLTIDNWSSRQRTPHENQVVKWNCG